MRCLERVWSHVRVRRPVPEVLGAALEAVEVPGVSIGLRGGKAEGEKTSTSAERSSVVSAVFMGGLQRFVCRPCTAVRRVES